MYAITAVTSSTRLTWNKFNDGAGYDGILGLGHVNRKSHDYWKTASLTDKLSRDYYVGQNVLSIYVSLKPGNDSFIKFGGWDKGAVAGDADPVAIAASTDENFGLKFKDFVFGDKAISLDLEDSVVLFDPAVRFMHVPADKFDSMRNTMN